MDQFYCDGDFDSETAKMRGEFAAVHSVLLHDFHQALGAGDSEQAAFGLWRFPLIRGAFRARSNLVGRVGSFPRLRTGRVFPRAWGY
jgi:hypothetical protein